mmetsp:Transcript_40830/g.86931  ORF Transcript_40830/g.86931 Transcript_40830/m.86931 type:complete len:235 (-) Transcript_40830:667-1371(-)
MIRDAVPDRPTPASPLRKAVRRARCQNGVSFAPLSKACALGVGDVLLQKVEARAAGAHCIRNIAGLHDKVLHILPVLPTEVQHPCDATVEGAHQRVVNVVGLRCHGPAEEDAVPDRGSLAQLRDQGAMFHRHGNLESRDRLAQLLRGHLDAESRIHTRQQRAHRARGSGQLSWRGAPFAGLLKDQWPGLDERPQDLVEDVLAALGVSVLASLVHNRQADPHDAEQGFLERHQVL